MRGNIRCITGRKRKEDSFPILAKLSKIYLNAPATVEPVE